MLPALSCSTAERQPQSRQPFARLAAMGACLVWHIGCHRGQSPTGHQAGKISRSVPSDVRTSHCQSRELRQNWPEQGSPSPLKPSDPCTLDRQGCQLPSQRMIQGPARGLKHKLGSCHRCTGGLSFGGPTQAIPVLRKAQFEKYRPGVGP